MRNQILNPDRFLVLIVDDIARNLQILEAILRPEGYALTFANSGQQALDRAKRTQPDIIGWVRRLKLLRSLQSSNPLQPTF